MVVKLATFKLLWPFSKVCYFSAFGTFLAPFFTILSAQDEPYRRLLMAIRRRCWRTKQSMEALYMGKQNDPDFEKEVLTSTEAAV